VLIKQRTDGNDVTRRSGDHDHVDEPGLHERANCVDKQRHATEQPEGLRSARTEPLATTGSRDDGCGTHCGADLLERPA
jgi:hypothetical protein